MENRVRIFTVDAFTSTPFSGGPAGVILVNEFPADEILVKVSSELNYAASAFLVPAGEEDHLEPWLQTSSFRMRWFTPKNEIVLCGHATLAAGHVLFEIGNKSDVLYFDSKADILKAKRAEDGMVTLDMPECVPNPLSTEREAEFAPLITEICGHFKVADVKIARSPARKLLVRLDDALTRKEFETLNVDSNRLLHLHDVEDDFEGVIITLKGDLDTNDTSRGLSNYHFISRYFSPWNAIPEDPVCGRQCSPRGAELWVQRKTNRRVELTGKAVTISSGHFSLLIPLK